MEKIVLASGSAARLEVLRKAGFGVKVLHPDIDERKVSISEPMELVRILAKMKLDYVTEHMKDEIAGLPVISADTLGWHREKMLFKPEGRVDARAILMSLGGDWHEVITGFSVYYSGRSESGISVTRVLMRDYSEEELVRYLDTGEYEGKAGAYAIQGRGGLLVERVEGCFFNVMGLPLSRVWEAMIRLGAFFDGQDIIQV